VCLPLNRQSGTRPVARPLEAATPNRLEEQHVRLDTVARH
jgi:hypothetical protein